MDLTAEVMPKRELLCIEYIHVAQWFLTCHVKMTLWIVWPGVIRTYVVVLINAMVTAIGNEWTDSEKSPKPELVTSIVTEFQIWLEYYRDHRKIEVILLDSTSLTLITPTLSHNWNLRRVRLYIGRIFHSRSCCTLLSSGKRKSCFRLVTQIEPRCDPIAFISGNQDALKVWYSGSDLFKNFQWQSI